MAVHCTHFSETMEHIIFNYDSQASTNWFPLNLAKNLKRESVLLYAMYCTGTVELHSSRSSLYPNTLKYYRLELTVL